MSYKSSSAASDVGLALFGLRIADARDPLLAEAVTRCRRAVRHERSPGTPACRVS